MVRAIRARWRLSVGVLCMLAMYGLLPATLSTPVRAILSWDVGGAIFLGLAAQLFTAERQATMAQDAKAQEEGEWTVFALTVGAVAASVAGIVSIYGDTKGVAGPERGWHVALVALTLLLSFLMMHTLFALRYAHEYYAASDAGPAPEGGLEFPQDTTPDYWDFFYFSAVLGMTFQVSDVQISSRKLRRLATAHGLLAFLFNTVFIALTVNLGASLLN